MFTVDGEVRLAGRGASGRSAAGPGGQARRGFSATCAADAAGSRPNCRRAAALLRRKDSSKNAAVAGNLHVRTTRARARLSRATRCVLSVSIWLFSNEALYFVFAFDFRQMGCEYGCLTCRYHMLPVSIASWGLSTVLHGRLALSENVKNVAQLFLYHFRIF